MGLTTAQLQALKADIAADGVLNQLPQNSDGAFEVATAYNMLASPDFTVWKSKVTLAEVGANLDSSEVESLTTAENARMQTFSMYNPDGLMPSRPDHRAFFAGVFSGAGGANTSAALLILWKRLATRSEKLFATGTGSDASPATLTVEGNISYQTVLAAWAS